MAETPGILFTAFEHSGDSLAAGMIRELRLRLPQTPIWGLGGPRMREAGAEVLEETTQRAVMLAGSLGQVLAHRKRLAFLRRWLADRPLGALVPVDSPAANWSICKLVREIKPEAKVVHLVSPQVWAWAAWRVNKLRRLTHHVLCLLPFEPAWLEKRGVPASFVSHPIFDPPWTMPPALRMGGAGNRLALLPGSRRDEIKRNWPMMLEVYRQLQARRPGLEARVAAADVGAGRQITDLWYALGQEYENLGPMHVVVGAADEVLAWADAVLVVSGTATLQVAAHGKPMAAVYNHTRLAWHTLGRWIIKTPVFTLPNLIDQVEKLGDLDALSKAKDLNLAVPEFVPHFGAAEPVAQVMEQLLSDASVADRQRQALRRVCAVFAGQRYALLAADAFMRVAGEAWTQK